MYSRSSRLILLTCSHVYLLQLLLDFVCTFGYSMADFGPPQTSLCLVLQSTHPHSPFRSTLDSPLLNFHLPHPSSTLPCALACPISDFGPSCLPPLQTHLRFHSILLSFPFGSDLDVLPLQSRANHGTGQHTTVKVVNLPTGLDPSLRPSAHSDSARSTFVTGCHHDDRP